MNRRFVFIALVLLGGCTLATGSCQYRTAGACLACSKAGLKRVPCPTGNAPDGDQGRYWFALRSLDFRGPSADAGPEGLDIDCSARSTSRPELCVPISDILDASYANFPDGVDNSLSRNTLGLIIDGKTIGDDINAAMNAEIDTGVWGAMLVLDGWNGGPDDDEVQARLVYSHGTSTHAIPNWDGNDTWAIPYHLSSDGLPDNDFAGGSAYVTHGVLVWDRTEAPTPSAFHFQNNASEAFGTAEISLFEVVITGPLSTTGASLTVSGGWSASVSTLYPNFLAGRDRQRSCDIRKTFGLQHSINWGGTTFPDLPSPPLVLDCKRTNCSQPCGATSVGFVLGFVPNAGPPHVEFDNRDPPGIPAPECDFCDWMGDAGCNQ